MNIPFYKRVAKLILSLFVKEVDFDIYKRSKADD